MVTSRLIGLPEDRKINTVRGNLYNVVLETFDQNFILNIENDFKLFAGQQCFSIVQQARETLGPLFMRPTCRPFPNGLPRHPHGGILRCRMGGLS